MLRALLLGLAVLLAGSQVGLSAEQTVEAIAPRGEQDVRPLTAPAEQRVDQVAVGGGGVEQQVVAPQVPPSGAAKAASTATKVVVVATTVAVSLGSMAAMLLFL